MRACVRACVCVCVCVFCSVCMLYVYVCCMYMYVVCICMYIYNRITHQWGGDQSTMKGTLTGGPSWQRQQPLQPTTLPPLQQGGTNVGSQSVDWSKGGMYGGYFPYQQPVQPQPTYGIVCLSICM